MVFFCLNCMQVTCRTRSAQRVSAARGTYWLGISGMAGFGGMRRGRLFLALLAAVVSPCGPAWAIVGEASPADIVIQRHTVLVYSAKGRCSGVVLAPRLVLTAAHCVEGEDRTYFVGGRVVREHFNRGGIAEIVRHPDFRHSKSSDADIALIKLVQPMPERFTPVHLQARPLRQGDRVIVGGYGIGEDGKLDAQITLRSAALVVARLWLGRAQLANANREEGVQSGPCGGDSGGPAFTYRGLFALVGIVSTADCKGKATIVAVSHYYDWILETAEKLGSPLK